MENAVHTTIRPKTKIAACAATESIRCAINGVCVIDGYGVATDGRTLAVAAMETQRHGDDHPKRFVVGVDAFRANLQHIDVNGSARATCGKGRSAKVVEAPLIEGTFPDVASVIPQVHSRTVWIHINAKLLANIADAVGSLNGAVSIGVELVGNELAYRPIAVLPLCRPSADAADAFGVIMPISGEQGSSDRFNGRVAKFQPKWRDSGK